MSQPIPIDLSELLNTLEKMYMLQRERGFAHPKPKLVESGDQRAADIPVGFLEWWKQHANCDINPVVAWKAKCFRDQFYRESKTYSQTPF